MSTEQHSGGHAQPRQPAGSPDGGQFAATTGTESTQTLVEGDDASRTAWQQLNNLAAVIADAQEHLDDVALTATATTLRTVCPHARAFDIEPDEDGGSTDVTVTAVHCPHTDPETGKPLARWVRQHLGADADHAVVTNDVYYAIGKVSGMPPATPRDDQPWWEHSGPGWPVSTLKIDPFLESRAGRDVPTAVLLDADERDALLAQVDLLAADDPVARLAHRMKD